MQKTSDYRAHATECRVLAHRATTDLERDQLLLMAENWDSLAQDREGLLARRSEDQTDLKKIR